MLIDINIMAFCGLIKAGVAFALVIMVEDSNNFMLVRTTVFGVVLGSLLVLSGMSTRFILFILMKKEQQIKEDVLKHQCSKEQYPEKTSA
jgi:Ca2+/H+ antiporter